MTTEIMPVLTSKHHTLALARGAGWKSPAWVHIGSTGRHALTPRAFVWALEIPWPELESTVKTFLAEHEQEELFEKLPIEGALIEGLRMSDYWGRLACEWLAEMPQERFTQLVMIGLRRTMHNGSTQQVRHAAKRLFFRNGGSR